MSIIYLGRVEVEEAEEVEAYLEVVELKEA